MESFMSYFAFIVLIFSSASADVFPDPTNCSTYISYDVNGVGSWVACPTGLDFSHVANKCLPPAEAKCQKQYWCPKSNPYGPVYVPDPFNCKFYYLCDQGTPIQQQCDYGLWWNILTRQCSSAATVLCDKRAIITPTNTGGYDTTTTVTGTTQTTTLAPTTTTVSTTTLPPTTSFCIWQQDLFDGSTYLKTACIVNTTETYANARQKCAANNMNLFVLENWNSETQLYDYMQPNWPGGLFWINGQRSNNSKFNWNVYNSDGTVQSPLFQSADFFSSYAIGNCLMFSGQYIGFFKALPSLCTNSYSYVCEHYKQTQTPPVLDTTGCAYTKDLYDPSSSHYIKSVCLTKLPKTYDDARRACKNIGMNLFAFDNVATTDSFFQNTEDFFSQNFGLTLWVNGRRDYKSNQWLTYHVNRTVSGLLYEGIEWVNVGGFYGRTTGYCLRITGERGPYQFYGDADCNRAFWYICEYLK